MMVKLYPNFNFLRIRCVCGSDILKDKDLKELAKQVIYECSDIGIKEVRCFDYAFVCKNCKKIVNKKIIVERANNVLIIE